MVGFRPCSEGFSPGSPVFLPPENPTLLNANSLRETVHKEPLLGNATAKSHCHFEFVSRR